MIISGWRGKQLALVALAASVLAGCADNPNVVLDRDMRTGEERRDDVGKLFGDILLFTTAPDRDVDEGATGVPVNSYLWRAALDTIAFMPISNADPFGGLILTDWYTPPETPEERLKMNVLILTRQLRADGIQVSVFRQVLNDSGDWVDQVVDPETAVAVENAILSRARQLRVAATATE